MRSESPQHDDPWPASMSIRLEGEPRQLLEALWVRESLGLRPGGDAPPPLLDTPPRSRAAVDAAELEVAWPEVWSALLLQAGGPVDAPALFERLQATADGSPERAELMRAALGSGWRDRYGDLGLGPEFDAWMERRFFSRSRQHPLPLDQTPERIALPSLIAAWRAGLTSIVTIPCRGEHTRILSATTLLMTEATHDDPARFAAALSTVR